MNEELRPCPFCGEMPITENNFAACANKSCPTYDNYWTNPQILTIEHWNTRPIEDELQKRIADLSQALGLITTLKPTMVMDADHPLDMAKEIVEYMTTIIANTQQANRGLCANYIYELNENIKLTARIAELEAAQRWRVVADGELPEKYRDETREYIPFLVCEGDRDYPFRAMYDGINWGDGMFMLDVTHWMPLPTPPEVQE